MNSKLVAQKRIEKDLKEFEKSPLEGIGIVSYNNNFYEYVANIELLNGPYLGYCVQLLIKIPNTYPINPPEITLFPNQIDNSYHHHIFGTNFCVDLFKNNYLPTNVPGTGYNSTYTLSSLLLQMQVFLSEPDFPKGYPSPSKKQVAALFKKMKAYKQEFQGENNEIIIHTWDNPYPKMHKSKPEVKKKPKVYSEQEELIENLTCSVLKVDYFSDKEVGFGYPIIVMKNNYFPIPELLSYDAFIGHIQNNEEKLNNYFKVSYKSSMGKPYHCWFPIYINEEHFNKNKQKILNALTVIVHGPSGIQKYDFHSGYIIKVFPKLLNSMLKGIIMHKYIMSEAFIRCYYHFFLLFQKLCEKFKDAIESYEFVGEASKKLKEEKRNNYHFENDILLLIFSKIKQPNTMSFFIRNFFIQNINFVCNSDQTEEYLKTLIQNQKLTDFFGEGKMKKPSDFFDKKFNHWEMLFEIANKNPTILDDFSHCDKSQFPEEKPFLSPKKDVEYVTENMYPEDEDFFADSGSEEEKEAECPITDYHTFMNLFDYIKKKFKENPLQIFNKLNNNEKRAALNIIQDYYELEPENIIGDENKDAFEKLNRVHFRDMLAMTNSVSKRKLVEYIYENNPNNKLLSIIFLTKKYFKDKQFMKELQDHCGCLLQIQMYSCLDETRELLEKIKTFSSLSKFIGIDIVGDDFDFITQALNYS